LSQCHLEELHGNPAKMNREDKRQSSAHTNLTDSHFGVLRPFILKLCHRIIKRSLQSIIKGSLEVKLPTKWRDEKQRWEEPERRQEKREKSRREKDSEETKIQAREMLGKSRNIVFFH